MIERDSICCSSVLDFDDPSRSQYSGRRLEGCSDSSNENSGSMLKVVVPVSDLQVVVGFYQMEIRTSHYQCSISSHANFF